MICFTDTHCHLNRLQLDKYDGDVNLALQAAREANVNRFMAIMCNLDEYSDMRAIVDEHQDVGMSVGIHPCEDDTMFARATHEVLRDMAKDDFVWAIGETGLDFYHSEEFKKEQVESLHRHIAVSQELKKPLVIHTRNAYQQTLDELKAGKAEHGIIHCFTEDWNFAKTALDMGFYISFSGIVSFKNAKQIHEVAKKVPMDRMLIETDSPYLAPVPFRGKPNQPLYVPHVAQALADLREVSIETIAQQTTQNFDALLNQYK